MASRRALAQLGAQLLPDLRGMRGGAARAIPAPPPTPAGDDPFGRWLERTTPQYTWSWPHLRHIRQALDRVSRGGCRRLMVFCPPRHGKSEMTTIRYPIYRLQADPTLPVLITGYNERFARRFGRRTRNLARECGIALASDQSAADEWHTRAGGWLLARGVGSPPTGVGFRLMVIDDPVKSREEAESAAYRDRVWDWYTDDLYTRLEPGGAIILILTRWHEDDLAGRLLQAARNGGEQWEVVRMPALAQAGDPLGRPLGAALCPARYDVPDLLRVQRVMGVRSFSALYQQEPQPADGTVFRREWFRIVERAPAGIRWKRYWDLAASTSKRADYTASAAVGMDEATGIIYVRDMVRGRWEWPEQQRIILQTMAAERGTEHGIEEALHGLAAVQALAREPAAAGVAFRGIRVEKDKLARALPWATRAEAGKIALVSGSWVGAFLDEVCGFPLAAHDDQVDTISGGVAMIGANRGMFA